MEREREQFSLITNVGIDLKLNKGPTSATIKKTTDVFSV